MQERVSVLFLVYGVIYSSMDTAFKIFYFKAERRVQNTNDLHRQDRLDFLRRDIQFLFSFIRYNSVRIVFWDCANAILVDNDGARDKCKI